MEKEIVCRGQQKESYDQPILIPHSVLKDFTAGIGKTYSEKSGKEDE